MKKIFGNLNLTWKKLIIYSIIIGVIVGVINSIPFLKDTSFTDPAIYFDIWILFGILIIMNSKSNLDSALKCFIFFLISQPLIYLVEVPFSSLGWNLFGYYKYWLMWTILCLPMGYIGYYLKKDKWWGLVFILFPMMIFDGTAIVVYLSNTIYSFPRHLLSYLFCTFSLIVYPICIFNNKINKIVGLMLGILLIVVCSLIVILNRPIYETEILCSETLDNGYEQSFDDTYDVYLKDSKYGEVSIIEVPSIESYCVHTKFTKAGNTELILESPDGNKTIYKLEIKMDTYKLKKIS